MQSLLVVTLLATLFFATHIGMSTTPIRSSLVGRIGESRFVTLYGVVASIQFAALLVYYAAHRFDGLPGLNLAAVPTIRWALITVIGIGIALIGGSLVGYADSPFSVRGHNFREPYGMERITRHGFFAGTFLLGGAHALLAAHLNGTVFFSSLAFLAVVGSRHQDFKLLHRGGEAYQHFLATTSLLPFAAIISGRQRLAWSELPWRGLLIGLAVAWALRTLHQWILAYDGAPALGAVLIFVIFAGLASVVSARRGRARQRSADAHTPTNLHDAADKAV